MKTKFIGREMFKKQSKRFLTMALCAGMALSNLGGVTAFAAGDNTNDSTGTTSVAAKTINVGANAMTIPESGWTKKDGQYLYFGQYYNPMNKQYYQVKYRVLDHHSGTPEAAFDDGTSTMSISGGGGDYLLLDSDLIYMAGSFSSEQNNDYPSSAIAAKLKEGQDINGNDIFSTAEQTAVASTDLNASKSAYAAWTAMAKDSASQDNKLFLLSAAELHQYYKGEYARIKYLAVSTARAFEYWTRSSDSRNTTHVATIGDHGVACSSKAVETTLGIVQYGITQAFNMDLSNVLFTSSDDAKKTDSLTKINKTSDSEWKVTLKDASKTVTAGTVSRNDQTISVPYSYTGDVEQVSVVITSGALDDDTSTVLYYGKLADASDSKSGTGSFTLPVGLPNGYRVYILAEDVNEWTYTDYASAPAEIKIPELPSGEPAGESYTVTFDSQEGSEVASQSVTENRQATQPENPTRDGSVFAGWYTDKECTTAYDFSDEITANLTLYAKWAVAATSSVEKYDATTDEAVDGNKKDTEQENVQKSEASNGYVYKAVEWTDKSEGKARITISTKNTDMNEQHGAVYAFTKCTPHGFSQMLALQNIQFLVEKYGSVDVIVADGDGVNDIVFFENITTTNMKDILSLLTKNISFNSGVHYNKGVYYGLCRYFADPSHNPKAVFVSYDSVTEDNVTQKPKDINTDIWETLKTYRASGNYYSIGQAKTDTVPDITIYQVKDYDEDAAIRAGLADPSVFVSMESMTSTKDVQADLTYDQSFADLAADGKLKINSGLTITDKVTGDFTITDVTTNTNRSSYTVNKDYSTTNQVSVGFTNVDSNSVAEVYIDVELKDKDQAALLEKWADTNVGNAEVTYTDEDGKESTKSVDSPQLCYTTTYKIDTKCNEGGTITDPLQVNPGDTDRTVEYAPKEGYRLKSVTVDGKEVDINTYPNSYTFGGDDDADGINENHTIAVEYEKVFTITTTVTNGSIDPSTTVVEGSEPTISFTGATGYTLKSVTLDPGTESAQIIYSFETSEGDAPTSYTFDKVTADHEIAVVYEKTPAADEVQVTTTVTGGTITGATTWKKEDAANGIAQARALVRYTANPGYRLKSVKVTDNDGNVTDVDITKFPDSYEVDNSGNWKVEVEFEPIPTQYQIITSVSGEDGGTVTGTQTVDKGKDSDSVTWTPKDGYRVKTVTVDGKAINPNDYPNGYTFENVTDNHTVQVEFEKIPEYSITTSVTHGSLTTKVNDGEPSTDVSNKVQQGGSATVTYTPEAGYRLKSVTVTDKDGNQKDITGTNPESYTFENVQTDWNISVEYELIPTYAITTTVNGVEDGTEGGTITPSQTVSDGDGKTVTITITPDPGYAVKTVEIDGEEVPITDLTANEDGSYSYTFKGIDKSHSVNVKYAKQHKITTKVENGTITEDQVVLDGDKATIKYSPKDGYVLKCVKVNGKEVDITDFKDSYTFDVVDEDATIEVVYEKLESQPKEEKLTIETSVKNGTITPSAAVNKGDDMTVTYKAKDGYKLSKVMIDGKEVDITKYPTGYTFKNVTAGHTIKVVFEKTAGVAAKTGDTMAPIAAVSVLCLAAAAGAIALVLVRRKRNA